MATPQTPWPRPCLKQPFRIAGACRCRAVRSSGRTAACTASRCNCRKDCSEHRPRQSNATETRLVAQQTTLPVALIQERAIVDQALGNAEANLAAIEQRVAEAARQ